jgi:hypothetical protein
MTDTEFASAPYVLHQHQMALIRAAEAIGALEKRVAKLEACLANPKALWDVAASVPVSFPSAPATDTDPAA